MPTFITRAKHTLFKTRRRTIFSIVFVGIVVLIGWKLLGNKTPQSAYQTAQAAKGTLVSSVAESGQVSVANRASVTTQASGVVTKVYVQNGDTVTSGQKIADISLDNQGQQKQSQAWASYLSAKSSLDAANAQLYSLQSTMFTKWQSFTTLSTNGVYQNSDGSPNTTNRVAPQFASPQDDWLAAEAAYKNQQTVISQAQAAVNSAWFSYQASSATITAPSAGTITDLLLTPGMQVGGGSGSTTTASSNTSAQNGTTGTGGGVSSSSQTVASIKSDGLPIINVSLSEIDAAKVKANNKVTLTFDAFPNQTFTGKVVGINTTGQVASGVTTYPATIVMDTQNDSILPNMSVSANIITEVKDNVLLVPTAAVQQNGNQVAVRVLKNGQITVAPVVTGDSSDTETEIVSGLNEGDMVVVGSLPTGQQSGAAGASPFSRNIFGGGGGGFGGGGRGGGGAAAGR
ncbi:MAG TPA: HlyD family efflux transporter periplasmic adaptor subunit [Candidatus Saccharimonadales bacterium]|nr:HlyD family efflux transporter periplasmic adaptor subunit [Candidatus Saccharimonadales bacterium]